MSDDSRQNDTSGSGSAGRAGGFEQSAQEKPPGLISEYGDFLLHNRKWWLTPIILVLLLLAVLLISSPAVMPFIYTIF